MDKKLNQTDLQSKTSAEVKSIEDFPLMDSIFVSKEQLHKSDEAIAQETTTTGEQGAKDSRFATEHVDESQSKIKGSCGLEFVETEPLDDSAQKPRKEKLSRKSSTASEFSLDKEEQRAGNQEEEWKEQAKEPKLGSFFFSYEADDNGVTLKVENQDTFDMYTHTLKNNVLQQGMFEDLFDSGEDFGNEIINLIKSYPNPFIEFDESSVELTLYQLVEFGRKKARKPLLEIRLKNQNEFLKPLELCKSSTSRLSTENTSEVQKLFLKVTDHLILQLEALENQTLSLHNDISKLEEAEVK